jgi:hypothetical protein
MSYRDFSESLRGYRARIAQDLEAARHAAKEAAERAARVSVLERELAETDGLLAKMGQLRARLPLLEDLRIAAPCKASWDDMVGDDHVRFCGHCEKNVYNLSSLPREEAEALLAARSGKMCVRLFKRADGTVLTNDCPVGVRKRRRRRAAFGAVGAGLMAAASAAGLSVKGEAPRSTDAVAVQGLSPAPTVTDGVNEPQPPPAPMRTAEPPVQGHWTAGAPLIRRPVPRPSKPPRPSAGNPFDEGP